MVASRVEDEKGRELMGEQTALHVVTKSDLASARTPVQWDDPENIAAMEPAKRTALLANPLSHRDDDPMQIIGTRDNRVIGRLDVIPGEFRLNSQPVPCLWTSALFVSEQFRKTLMGVSLMLKMQALCPTVAACALSQMALPLLLKLRWMDIAMPRYLMLRKSRAVVQRYLGGGIRGKIARPAADLALLGQRAGLAMLRSVKTIGLHSEPSAQMSADMDAQLAKANRPIATHRSSAWINWTLKYSVNSSPQDRRELFYIRDRDGEIIAYFIIKARFYPIATHRNFRDLLLGSLADWMIFAPQRLNLKKLMLLATNELMRWHIDAIEVCVPPDEIPASFRSWGFVPVGHLHLAVRAAPNSPLADVKFQNPPEWRVRPADGDNLLI